MLSPKLSDIVSAAAACGGPVMISHTEVQLKGADEAAHQSKDLCSDGDHSLDIFVPCWSVKVRQSDTSWF